MLTEVHLHGSLGEKFGREWKLDVYSPGEVIRALNRLRPGFLDAIAELTVKGGFDFWVQVGDETIGESRIESPACGQSIHITPVIQGASTGKGIGEIIAGVVLIAAGLVITAYGGGAYGVQLALLGVALAFGGVATLLAPSATQTSSPSKNRPSYTFSGPVNTIEQGLPVQVCYGEVICGTNVVSVGIQTADITQGSTAGGPTDQTGGGSQGGGQGGGGGGQGGLSNAGPGQAAVPITSAKSDGN